MTEPIDVHKIFAKYFQSVETLAYALSATLADGSICLDPEPYKNLILTAVDPMQINPFWTNLKDFEQQLQPGKYLAENNTVLKPFVLHNGKVYLQRYFEYETRILEKIQRLNQNLRIITGGPGTGKTYSVGMELMKLFKDNPGLKVALAAPTGKAAARMHEAIRDFTARQKNLSIEESVRLTSLKARTIHRLLGYIPNSVFFRHNEEKPLPYDVVVIDEASMIDGALMAKLFNAIGTGTCIYLIGDKDQMASVEAGSVFGDICRTGGEAKVMEGKIKLLEKVYRTESEDIIEFSKEILGGRISKKFLDKEHEDKMVDYKYDLDLFVGQTKLFAEYILEEDINAALQKLNRVRVLCVTREFDHSVAESNARIEKLLKKEINDADKFSPRAGFYHNQPIIITQNDYDLNLANGDVGLIRRDENGMLKAWFETQDGKERMYPAGYLNHYQTVFAMTIHKSQGSEFDHVVVLLPEKRARKLLTRELIYTAVTRARKKVLIQSTEESLDHCLNNVVSRASGLTERIIEVQKELI